MPQDDSIPRLLASIGLSHFLKLLQNNGVDDAYTLACLSTDELKELGIPRHGDRLKLLLAAREGTSSVPLPCNNDVKLFFQREESLTEYLDAVVKQGLDSIALLGMMAESDMEVELGISKLGHRKKLAMRVAERTTSPQNSPQNASAVTSPSHNSTPGQFTRPVRPTHLRMNLSNDISEDEVQQIHNVSTGSTVSTNSISMVPPSSVSSAPLPATDSKSSTKGWSVSSFMEPGPERASTPGLGGGVSKLLSPVDEGPSDAVFSVPSSAAHIGTRRVSTNFTRTNTSSTAQKKFNPTRVNSQPVGKSRVASVTDMKFSPDLAVSTEEPKYKLLKVFENGRTKDDRGCMLSKTVPIPYAPNIQKQTIYNIITRALGWHNSNCNIYRQGEDAAGGTAVGNLWAFNGKPLTSWDDLVNDQWVVAGTANSAFINMLGAQDDAKKQPAPTANNNGGASSANPPSKAGSTKELMSWADRLSDPHSYTGTHKNKHAQVITRKAARPASGSVANKTVKQRLQETRLGAKNENASPKHVDPAPATRNGRSSTTGSVSPPPSGGARRTAGKGLSSTTGGIHTPRTSVTSLTGNGGMQPRAASSVPPNGRGTASDDKAAPSSPASAKSPRAPLRTTSDISPILSHSLEDLEGLVPTDLESANRTRLLGWERGLLLGRGNFGMVYQGKLKDGSEAAVKIVDIGKTSAVDELKQLFIEIRFIEKLEHPHIVKYYGCLYDEQDGQVQIFLQLMTGGSLASLIQKHKGAVPLHLVTKYTRQLLQGLDYLHARKVVHRDVKGANVLIHANGDCALADFGTSKSLDNMLSQTHGCTTMVGTPYWMAPEVITACDDGAYGTKVDVWSVGCTIVEMVTGNPPWSGLHENMWAAIFHIAQSSEPPPLPEDLPKEIQTFLIKTFDRQPAKRPSCTQLLQEPWMLS